ncbi:MAG: CPBP family intramembrane metalloprotease [Proteobacteria bacterium]|nr:CPBP family intramembrane metalloprotease [Pseudomonadota bacterium]
MSPEEQPAAKTETPQAPALPRGLGAEVAIVFVVQLALVVGLVRLDAALDLGGGLHALVGVVFLLLPIVVLDRRGRPYARYGVRLGRPLVDLPWVLGAMVVAFVPVALASPWAWGVAERSFDFAWPSGYPGAAIAQLVVVAGPEELFFRGYLMGRLDDLFGARGRFRLLGAEVGPSLVVQAALFALGHFAVDLAPHRLLVFFPALAFGWLKARRGTIVAPILFHAASNVFMDILRAGYGFR